MVHCADCGPSRRGRALVASWLLMGAFWALIAASIIAANLISPGADWYEPSLSHFGEAGAKTAPVYNGLHVAAALVLVCLAIALPRACRPLETAGVLDRWRRLAIGLFVAILAVSLIVIALLPYNLGGRYGWPVFVAHNVAGWTEAVAPVSAMLLLPWGLPGLRRGFYVFSWTCLIPLLVAWYAFVVTHTLAHGLTELTAYGVVGIWGFALLAELTRSLRGLRTAAE